jgi:hypothetical protein
MDGVGRNGEDAEDYGGSQQGGAETAHDVSLPWRRSGVTRRDALIVWAAQAGPPELVSHTGDPVPAPDLLGRAQKQALTSSFNLGCRPRPVLLLVSVG